MNTNIPGINTSYFSLDNYNTEARVVDVVDGDTVVLVLQYLGVYYKFNARVSGIDCAEMSSKNTLLKEHAMRARDAVMWYFIGNCNTTNYQRSYIQKFFEENYHVMNITCRKFDKYGRLLIECPLSGHLLGLNLAYKYQGREKLSDEEQLVLLGEGRG
jgi:hypothetical protein